MFALSRLIETFAEIFDVLIGIYQILIIGAVIISWFRPDPYNPLVRFIHQTTEPVFNKVRRLLPRSWQRSGLDLSPLIVLFILLLIKNVLIGQLHIWARQIYSN